ncbi:hypothetical protein [Flavobacterium sp.]|uniref:hypothetical protein n=1 Tax=Flavobacterium sp. TaxID=239 RepID=UPI003D6ADE97
METKNYSRPPLEDFKIGHVFDWKFGLITREVERLSDDAFQIHDTSGSWVSAIVNLETMKKLTTGEISLLSIDFK